jgi:rare lipoprotein A (peptidoglycan hydrolase)
MIPCKATREGLIGQTTASGYIVDRFVPFVALPSVRALHRFVRVNNPANGKHTIAFVLDVGPWNEHDDRYVFQPAAFNVPSTDMPVIRPQAESGTDERGRPTNHAGIDLSEAVWLRLGMKENGPVLWEFID